MTNLQTHENGQNCSRVKTELMCSLIDNEGTKKRPYIEAVIFIALKKYCAYISALALSNVNKV